MVEHSRIEWVRGEMVRNGVDLFAAFTPSGHSMGATNATRVLSGFKNMGDACVLLDADGGRTLIVSPSWDAERAREQAADRKVVASDDLAGAGVVGDLAMGTGFAAQHMPNQCRATALLDG
jgi:hypothetical protein